MFYIVTATFTLKSAADSAKAFTEAMKKPQKNIKRIGMYISYGGDGIKTWFICEIDKEHGNDSSS